MGKNNVMANRNSFCARFINYAAVLIFAFLSSHSFAYTGDGGDLGGGGAGGSWDDACHYTIGANLSGWDVNSKYSTSFQACSAYVSTYNSNILNATISLRNSDENACYVDQTLSNGSPGVQNYQIQVSNTCSCPVGYEKDTNGKCVPKKCPVGQTLINGQCKPKTCPAGQALDANGNCMPRDDQCPAGQTMVNGRCTDKPDDDEPDPNSELPPFCEWASVMCQWHKEWQQWSNDYAANEQKANLDREELKRLALDSKENLDEINQKMTEQNQKLDDHKIKLDEIKNQDQQFYDELRLWLQNFDSTHGNPSEQNPSIEFPPFCDWSVQVCNWYLDWKDWRADYNAHNEALLQKFNEIKDQDKDYYDRDLEQNKDFYDDVRNFFDWYKDQADQNPSDPNDPNNPENQDGDVAVEHQVIPLDETKRINFVNACPAGEQFTVSFMGHTQNLEFSYQPLCQFMSMIRPFVIAIAYLIGAYILMGLSRGSSE